MFIIMSIAMFVVFVFILTVSVAAAAPEGHVCNYAWFPLLLLPLLFTRVICASTTPASLDTLPRRHSATRT